MGDEEKKKKMEVNSDCQMMGFSPGASLLGPFVFFIFFLEPSSP